MESPTPRLAQVLTLAFPGILHEFATPLSVIQNDARYLAQETASAPGQAPADLAEVAEELELQAVRLNTLLRALKTLPWDPDQRKSFGPVCNSVLTVLHNHWKYAWTVRSELGEGFSLPCSEIWAWVAWAEVIQGLTTHIPKGGDLWIRPWNANQEPRFEVILTPKEGGPVPALRQALAQGSTLGPFSVSLPQDDPQEGVAWPLTVLVREEN